MYIHTHMYVYIRLCTYIHTHMFAYLVVNTALAFLGQATVCCISDCIRTYVYVHVYTHIFVYLAVKTAVELLGQATLCCISDFGPRQCSNTLHAIAKSSYILDEQVAYTHIDGHAHTHAHRQIEYIFNSPCTLSLVFHVLLNMICHILLYIFIYIYIFNLSFFTT